MMGNKKQWTKNLYGNQEYPDNYTDKSFLKGLQKNIDLKEVTLREAMVGATLLTQEMCTVVAFVLIYLYLYNEWIEPNYIFYYSSFATLCGFILYRVRFSNSLISTLMYDLRTLLIFLVFGHLFSPVLHTLTDTISTDSIYTTSFFMMLIHLIFFDYGVASAIVSNSLSLSAAVFGSVCLASRLASAYHAFVLITIAIECFVLLPLLRNKIEKPILVTSILTISLVILLLNISTILSLFFVFVLIFINVICPVLFMRSQRYKDNIYGPWDEAIVQDVDNIANLIYSL